MKVTADLLQSHNGSPHCPCPGCSGARKARANNKNVGRTRKGWYNVHK